MNKGSPLQKENNIFCPLGLMLPFITLHRNLCLPKLKLLNGWPAQKLMTVDECLALMDEHNLFGLVRDIASKSQTNNKTKDFPSIFPLLCLKGDGH